MRAALTLTLTFVAGGLLLAACSQPVAPPSGPATPVAPEPTDAQRQAALTALPAPYNTASLENGQMRFALCRSCHTINQGGGTSTGPNLFGIVGRRAGTVPGFSYSDGMRGAGFTWDGPHLDTWLTNPRAMIPGTKMTYAGLPGADDRRDLISYLMVDAAPPPAAAPAAPPAGNAPSPEPAPEPAK